MKTLGILPAVEGTNIFPFDSVFNRSIIITDPAKQVAEVDAILLWGGMDIAPVFYDEEAHPKNQQQHGASRRDLQEWAAMVEAAKQGKPMIGVCRGAQFLCAFAGGKLNQHMENHQGRVHTIQVGAKQMKVACDHHQSMNVDVLPKEDYFLMAHDPKDYTKEVVYFKKIKALAIQPHPEWQDQEEPFVKWVQQKVLNLINPEGN